MKLSGSMQCSVFSGLPAGGGECGGAGQPGGHTHPTQVGWVGWVGWVCWGLLWDAGYAMVGYGGYAILWYFMISLLLPCTMYSRQDGRGSQC